MAAVVVPALVLIVALALVAYFNWRGGLKNRIVADDLNDDQFPTAA